MEHDFPIPIGHPNPAPGYDASTYVQYHCRPRQSWRAECEPLLKPGEALNYYDIKVTQVDQDLLMSVGEPLNSSKGATFGILIAPHLHGKNFHDFRYPDDGQGATGGQIKRYITAKAMKQACAKINTYGARTLKARPVGCVVQHVVG